MNQYEVTSIPHEERELNTYCVNNVPTTNQQPYYQNTSPSPKKDEGNFFSYIVFGVLSLLPIAYIYTYVIPYFDSLGSISIVPASISSMVFYALGWIILLKGLSFIVRLLFNIAESIYHYRMRIAKVIIALTVGMFILARVM
jgi:hypothetical protein